MNETTNGQATQPTPQERFQDAAARVVASDILRSGQAPHPSEARFYCPSLRCTIVVTVIPDGAPPPKDDTPCEAAIMAVLREATYPVTADTIETRANAKALSFSTSTIRHALAQLTRTRRVLNGKKPPRGYYLPGKFQSPVRPDTAGPLQATEQPSGDQPDEEGPHADKGRPGPPPARPHSPAPRQSGPGPEANLGGLSPQELLEVIRLDDAAALLPSARSARPALATVRRWCDRRYGYKPRGWKGAPAFLKVIKLGPDRVTHPRWLEEFKAAIIEISRKMEAEATAALKASQALGRPARVARSNQKAARAFLEKVGAV